MILGVENDELQHDEQVCPGHPLNSSELARRR